MNYRHAFHAGNFADVFKHIILARMIEYMKTKDKAFRLYDTHAGLGMYNLASEEAQKTEEAQAGVGAVLAGNPPKEVTRLIGPWLDAVRDAGEGKYPGSPAVAKYLMRKIDRLTLYELHEEDHAVLAKNFADDYQTRVLHLDGWLAVGAHTPPKEGRGMMLIDPPFEDGKDFDRMIIALEKARKKWMGGTMALWYPIKKREHTDDWLETLKGLKYSDILNVELYIREPRAIGMLNGCGMVIVNPPYTLRDELNLIMPWLAETMMAEKGWGYRIQDLSAR
ncbi:MAG: 23S rRNA (adenine(2030)-N(6))-methyltransferase RlmJ [Rhizobiaceae bacterium]